MLACYRSGLRFPPPLLSTPPLSSRRNSRRRRDPCVQRNPIRSINIYRLDSIIIRMMILLGLFIYFIFSFSPFLFFLFSFFPFFLFIVCLGFPVPPDQYSQRSESSKGNAFFISRTHTESAPPPPSRLARIRLRIAGDPKYKRARDYLSRIDEGKRACALPKQQDCVRDRERARKKGKKRNRNEVA